MTMQTMRRVPSAVLALLLLLMTAGCFQPSGAALEATQAAQGVAGLPTIELLAATEVVASTELLLSETPLPSITPSPVSTDLPTLTPSPTETPTLAGFPTMTETPTLAGFPTITDEPAALAFVPTATDTPSPTPNLFVTIEPTRYLTLTPLQVAQVPLDPILQTATQLAIQAGIGVPAVQPTQDILQPVQPVVSDPLLLTATAVIAGATQTMAAPMTLTMQAILGPSPTPGIILPTTGIITDVPGVFPTATLAGPIVSGTDCVHEVQATDRNLFRISLSYGVTVNQIAAASGIANPALILVGQRLVIPGCGTTGFRPPPTSVPPAASPGTTTTAPTTNVCGAVYIVQQDDTLFEISLRCGVPVMTIANLNGITNINLIYINDELRLQ